MRGDDSHRTENEPKHWFVYEHTCAAPADDAGLQKLRVEGLAMLGAAVDELLAVAGVHVTTLAADELTPSLLAGIQRGVDSNRTRRLTVEPSAKNVEDLFSLIGGLAREADCCLIIAPETGGVLESVARAVLESGGVLFSPDVAHIAVFADKRKTSGFLGDLAVPLLASGAPVEPDDDYVIKPLDGAGSLLTARCRGDELERTMSIAGESAPRTEFIVQPYWPGASVSLAIVADGQGSATILPPAYQRIASRRDHRFTGTFWLEYAGGAIPVTEELAQRAIQLAQRFLQRCPGIRGYVGLDLLLSARGDASFDRICEVNPRLTSSFCAYSRLLPGRPGALFQEHSPGAGGRSMVAGLARQSIVTAPGGICWDGALRFD